MERRARAPRARPLTGIDADEELLVATKGIRDGVTRAEEGAAPAGACENPWGHNVSALLSLTVESDKRRRALVRHQCGDAVGPCLIWVRHGPWV